MYFFPPPPPPAIVQQVNFLATTEDASTILPGERGIYEERARQAASAFNDVVVAGYWGDVLGWTISRRKAVIFTEEDVAVLGARHRQDNMATPTWPARNREMFFSSYEEVLACALLQGQGALRGALVVCVNTDSAGQPLDPRIFSKDYRLEIILDIFNMR